MNDYFQDNKRSLLLLAGLLLIFAIVLYFVLLRPLMSELSSNESAITSATDEIAVLEQQLANMDEEITETDVDQLVLEKKIPTERKLDEYLRDIQRLEVMTNSKIEQIQFVYDSNLGEQEKMEDDENEDEMDELEEEVEIEKVEIDPEILKEKPENLQVMTVKITAHSPDFNEFITFLETIENEERISIVTNLKLKKPTERDIYFEEYETALGFEIELTTFYFKG